MQEYRRKYREQKKAERLKALKKDAWRRIRFPLQPKRDEVLRAMKDLVRAYGGVEGLCEELMAIQAGTSGLSPAQRMDRLWGVSLMLCERKGE